MADDSLQAARAAKARALEIFSELGDVVGVGITRIDDRYGLKINLSAPPNDLARLPVEVDGVPITVEGIGAIRKRSVP